MTRSITFWTIIFLIFIAVGCAQQGLEKMKSKSSTEVVWDLKQLSKPPTVYPAPEWKAEDVQALFYEALPYNGKPTRVFAWYGVPERKGNEKFPAVVLVHGGGGTAYDEWVRIWNKRGYAAIAMDNAGTLPKGEYPRPSHEFGCPSAWNDDFSKIDLPQEEHWAYHAVAQVILANSLLRSFPEVDSNNIGITGISWGGYLTCIAAGLDQRFKFAISVYGCGFITKDSAWVPTFENLGPEKTEKWFNAWDPSRYLDNAKMPMLWITGPKDTAYPLSSLQKSYRLPKVPRSLTIRVDMLHDHPFGWAPEEIYVFADSVTKNTTPLPIIIGQGQDGDNAWISFSGKFPVIKAELNYTKDSGDWKERKWFFIPAELDSKNNRASALIPKDTTVYYFNVTDQRNLLVSSEHVALACKESK